MKIPYDLILASRINGYPLLQMPFFSEQEKEVSPLTNLGQINLVLCQLSHFISELPLILDIALTNLMLEGFAMQRPDIISTLLAQSYMERTTLSDLAARTALRAKIMPEMVFLIKEQKTLVNFSNPWIILGYIAAHQYILPRVLQPLAKSAALPKTLQKIFELNFLYSSHKLLQLLEIHLWEQEKNINYGIGRTVNAHYHFWGALMQQMRSGQ